MMHAPPGHRSLPCTPQHAMNAQSAGHNSLHVTPQHLNTAQRNSGGAQRRLVFRQTDVDQGSPFLQRVGEASAMTTHHSAQQLQAKLEEKERENRMLQAQLIMATDKAQMDIMMLQEEHDRKVGLLVDRMRLQRLCLEITKDGLAEIRSDLPELQAICCDLSHTLQSCDAGSNHASQRLLDLSQSLCDTGGESSSQGSRRSAAGTVMSSEGAEADSHKLYAAQQKIRKLEAELAVSQERSKRIAGLEDEMETYTSIQDQKIQDMQYQICDLMSKLEAERKRNDELAKQHSKHWSPGTSQKTDTPPSMKTKPVDQLAATQTVNQERGAEQGTWQRADTSGDRSIASANHLSSQQRGYSPYNPIEFRDSIKDKGEGQRNRRSVSELASKFEFGHPPSGSDSPVSAAAAFALSEREITNSPRPRKLTTSALGETAYGQGSLVQKAISLYDSRGKQQGASESKMLSDGYQTPVDVSTKSNGRPQSSHLSQSQRLQSNLGRAASLDSTVPSDVSTKPSGACAGNATPVNTSTLDILLAEYSGQQEEINPSYNSSNALNDFPHSSWSMGKTAFVSASPHNARPVPRVLHVQGSSQSVSALPYNGHGSPSQAGMMQKQAGLPYAEFKQSGSASMASREIVRGLQAI